MHAHPHPHSVDIDSETIHFDGAWRTREELVAEIRTMLDAGNYGIARQSAALETLAEAMADVRRVEFRATSSLADDLFAAAQKEGRTPDALLRDAVARYLASRMEDANPRLPQEPEGRRQTYPELRAMAGLVPVGGAYGAGLSGAWAGEVPVTVPEEDPEGLGPILQASVEAGGRVALAQDEVVTEPVSPEEAAQTNPVELPPKHRADGEGRPERRWFDGP